MFYGVITVAKKQIDEDEFLKLKEIEDEIARECKQTVKAVAAWRYLVLWLSSFSNGVLPGKGDANHYLSAQQSSEFAFTYDPEENPDVLVILAQNKIFECFCDIGIKCAIIEPDGIVIVIKDLDINGFFISGFSVKIQCSLALSDKLLRISKHAKEFQIGKIEGKYNSLLDKISWKVTDIFDVNFPIAPDLKAAKFL